MKKTLYKRILNLSGIMIFIMLLNISNVYAADNCESYNSKSDWDEKYGVSLDEYIPAGTEEDNGDAILKINPKDVTGIDKSKIKFKVEITDGVGFFTQSATEITASNNIIFTRLGNDMESINLDVKLTPLGFEDPQMASACGKGKGTFEIHADFDSVRLPVEDNETADEEYQQAINEFNELKLKYQKINKSVSCDKKYNEGSFENKFCQDRATAKAKGAKEYNFGENKSTDKVTFKCSTAVSEAISADYYENKKYLIGVGEYTISDKYHYNYDCGKKTEEVSCKVKCEEVVTVEYGPPVASKAGLCFEYKVKVTSRVTCATTQEPKEPKPPTKPCTPVPVCKHKGSSGHVTTYHQGGPSDEFDDCIESCDGGEYTDKCSKKCYKEVYGSNKVLSNTTGYEIDYVSKIESKLNNEEVVETVSNSNHFSCHNNSIDWVNGTSHRHPGGDNKDHSNDSPWHINHSWGVGNKSEYTVYSGKGIPKRPNCNDKCYWKGCKHSYIKKGTSNSGDDYKKNIATFKTLMNKCQSFSSCNTTQAEFRISVDYTAKKTNEKYTIYFPYTENNSDVKDTIKYENHKISSTKGNNNTTILSSDGCYDGKDNNHWYQTEWSFPGTWIHAKTGEISYTPITDKSWFNYKEKFCVPLDAKDVNTKWWNYYYAKRYGKDNSFSYNNQEYMSNVEECPKGTSLSSINCNYTGTKFTSEDKEKLEWNLKASAKKFGHFEWNIDIKCFYALNSTFPKGSDKKCEPNCLPDGGEEKMRIRSVDLTNLFPDSEGTVLSSSDNTGRSPGFNWTNFSTITPEKNLTYNTKPSNYTIWVQKKGYNVYSDDYLDYEVTLTKDILNKIRKSDRNYTEYAGETDIDAVTHYQSTLFRDGGLLSDKGKNHYPEGKALKCNNMKNYKSSECQDIESEVK